MCAYFIAGKVVEHYQRTPNNFFGI